MNDRPKPVERSFSSHTTGPLVDMMERLVSPQRRATYEMFRVECVVSGQSDRMARALRLHPLMALETGYRALMVLLAAEEASDLLQDLVSRARQDVILTHAVASATVDTRAARAFFGVACDVVTLHRESRTIGVGRVDPQLARRHLVAELARINDWYDEYRSSRRTQ